MGLRKLLPPKVYENLINIDHFESSSEKSNSAQKIKFSIKDFFGKCDQIRRKLREKNYITIH